MKKFFKEFLHRGLMCMGFGPIVLSIIWGILYTCGVFETLTGVEVVYGVLGITLLAFIAAGVTAVYQIEEIPLLYSILIHGATLYLGYLTIYLVNGWLKNGVLPLIVFTLIFVFGFFLIWAIVYIFIRKDIDKMNKKIRKG